MFGDHCLTFSCGGDRTKHHNLIRNEVFFLCNSAGLNPELERPGLLQPRPLNGSAQESGAARDPNVSRRPADVYLPKWRRGAPAAMDIAVTSGMRGDMLHKSANDGTSAANEYENFKRSYLNTEQKCHENGITFIPLIMEAHGGGWGTAATAVWSQVAKYKSTISGDTVSTSAMLISQSMGLILHRENARAILRRSQINDNSEFIELLGAYAACSSSVDV